MKNITSILLALFITIAAYAGPANSSVVNIVCYDAQGTLLRSGYGFFVSSDGRVCLPYRLISGASRADVIDWSGKKFSALRIAGASSAYDIAVITTNAQKVEYLNQTDATATEGQAINLLYYTTNKKDKAEAATITMTEPYGEYTYYTTTVPNNAKYYGCPITNANNQVVGIVQQNVTDSASSSYAIDARLVGTLGIDAMSALDSDFAAIGLPRQLPDDEVAAYSLVYILARAPQTSPLIVTTALDDYITAYPDSTKGYLERATYNKGTQAYSDADKDIALALKLGTQTAEVHYQYGRLIYAATTNDEGAAQYGWTLDRARQEAEEAYRLNPQPLYKILLADIAFTESRYDEAQRLYTEVAESSIGAPEHHYYAARACRLVSDEGIIPEDRLQAAATLLDKSLSSYRSPYPAEVAPYLLERAQNYIDLAQYRLAVLDLNEYEKTVTPSNLNAEFYIWRMQTERSAKMYKQALDDGQTALSRCNKDEAVVTMLEIALTYLQAGNYAEAASVASNLVEAMPDNSDTQKIFGISLGYLGKTSEALTHLKRARELGDDSVDTFITKFSSAK